MGRRKRMNYGRGSGIRRIWDVKKLDELAVLDSTIATLLAGAA
jgi:hypothetical protein